MRSALNRGGLALAQTAVTAFAATGDTALVTNPSEEFDYDEQEWPGTGAVQLQDSARSLETLGLLHEFHAHNSTINDVWTSPSSPFQLATCSSDECVKLWDTRAALPGMVVPVGREVWNAVATGTDELAQFYDVRTGNKLGQYGESHVDAITKVRFHPTQPAFVVTASEDGSILNVESAVTNVGFFGPQQENIFCLTGTETLDLWNLWTAERLHHYDTIRDDCNKNGLSTDYLIDCVYDDQSNELFLLAGNHDGDMNALQHAAALKGGHKACVRCIYYDPENTTLYTGGEDTRLCKWTVPGAAEATDGYSSSSSSRRATGLDPAGIRKARKASQSDGFYKKDECSKYYKLGKTLGRTGLCGSFATVKSAISKADNSRWAVKCIDKASLTAEDEEALRVEVEVLQLVHHTNIVQLKEVFDCHKTFYMVMEEMSGGELFDRIVEKEKYSEKEASCVVKKLADALLYCHQKGIVHRDLKPENLLYQSTDDNAEIKIADFGLAKLIRGDSLMQTACGTPGYVAPEILEGRPYGAEVDLWSLGVIAYILLCGFPPFYDENNAALFQSIKSGVYDYPSPYWDCVSDSAKDLISRLLVVDPKKRFTAQQVLEHPWVADIHGVSGDALPHFTQEMKRYNAHISALNSAQKRVSASDFDPPVAAIAAVGLEAVKTAAPTTTEGGTPAAQRQRLQGLNREGIQTSCFLTASPNQ
ncbi:Calcium/calmodulin-dependent/calcium-dependent protein kinase [Phytophthora cactorum]|nr:Calcium/calmodulin-dependent/calcium-dependent protein kinase [Phytophthora cactorum]